MAFDHFVVLETFLVSVLSTVLICIKNFAFYFQVQAHWHRYTEKQDKMVEEAFRLNVKWSLQELSKAINGDGKSAPNPLFRVRVCLEGDKVEFAPTLKQLASIVGSIGSHLTNSISDIHRLPTLLTKKKSTKDVSFTSSKWSTQWPDIYRCIIHGSYTD